MTLFIFYHCCNCLNQNKLWNKFQSVLLDCNYKVCMFTLDANNCLSLIILMRGTWVAQSVKCPTLGFSSVYDLTVHEFELPLGSVLAAWSLGFTFTLSLLVPLPCTHTLSLSLSLSQNKYTF